MKSRRSNPVGISNSFRFATVVVGAAIGLAVLLSAACAKKSEPRSSELTVPIKPAAPIELATLISADAIGVLRQPGDQFAPLLLSRGVAKKEDGALPVCWQELERAVTAGYQVSLPVGSYFILEGNLREEDVTQCVAGATRGLITGRRDGALVVFATPSSGSVFAAWRGKYIVLGNGGQVERAVEAHNSELSVKWRTLLTEPAETPVWMVRTDTGFGYLVGAPATKFVFAIDTMEGPPKSYLAGRFMVHYANELDADKSERYIKDWIARGKYPAQVASEGVALFDQLATALQGASITRKGTVLEVKFDSDMFAGLWPTVMNVAASLGAKAN